MKRSLQSRILSLVLASLTIVAYGQHKRFGFNDQWIQEIQEIAPDRPEVTPTKEHRVLIFGLHTGFYHWTIPHTNEVIKLLGEKSGAYEAEVSSDVYKFSKKELAQFDAVVLNNNCSVGPRRDLFLDALEKEEGLTETKVKQLAAKFEDNLIQFVAKGGGLMVVHGGIVMQNNSMEFSDMVGGSFDYHPPQQELEIELYDANHPLVKAFDGQSFTHIDEPYIFKHAYEKKNFRPLLYFDSSKLTKTKKEIPEKIKYVSWIKRHGKGRVFYTSPSHNAQSMEDPRMLKFYLDGAQYVLGDLPCDDSSADLSTDIK